VNPIRLLRLRGLALTVVALLATLFGAASASAASANASGGAYAALGDSYSSGYGASSTYIDSTCDTSTAAYGYLYAQATSPSSFDFAACAGAVTTDVIDNQLGGLNSSTALVSMTIGGNDVGFSNVMQTCLLSSDATCLSAVATAESTAQNQLPAKLDTTYSDIRQAAPNAHVVILGYPEFYDRGQSSCSDTMDATKRTALDNGSDLLDNVIQTEVAKYSGFTYEDVRSRFAGHEICDSTPWINNWYDFGGAYHPSAAGQANAYLPGLEAGV
jgi:lysophospholipase L1-like esterase